MRFKALPVTSLEDVTLDLEQLSALDVLDLTGESVLQLAVTGTKRKVAFGMVPIAFTASGVSATSTVSHGLGAVPSATTGGLAGLWTTSTLSLPMFSASSTQLTAQLTSNVAITANLSLWWIAIG